MESFEKLFESLIGVWSIKREITQNNQIHFAKGEVKFSKTDAPNILQYSEVGKLELNKGKTLNFHRKYKYELVDNEIIIRLDDTVTKGKVFQKLIQSTDSCEFQGTEHVCKQDLHNGKYEFVNEEHFIITYEVSGKTNSLIITHFDKLK